MKGSHFIRLLMILTTVMAMIAMPLLVAGCSTSVTAAPAVELASTMVPSIDLDLYIYANQQVPTVIPKDLIGTKSDISVQSLAIWGVVNGDNQYALGGALIFSDNTDAGSVFDQISKSANIYTKLSGSTIYFLQGSGGPLETMKNAIDNNDFKKYNDSNALAAVATFPTGGTTNAGLIAVVKPSQAAINLVKQYLGQNTADTVNTVFSDAKPHILALGIFGSQPLNLADLAQSISDNTIWNMDLGVVVAMDSIYPGFIFSPIAGHVIADQGFPEVNVGNLTAYKDSVNLSDGKTIPIYLNISGDHIFAASSGNDAYAQTLLTNINR